MEIFSLLITLLDGGDGDIQAVRTHSASLTQLIDIGNQNGKHRRDDLVSPFRWWQIIDWSFDDSEDDVEDDAYRDEKEYDVDLVVTPPHNGL